MESEILKKAKEYMHEGRLEKVQIILRRALDESPNNAKVLEMGGDLALKLGREDEAVQRYEHASDNYTHNNQYAEAIVCLEKILKIEHANEPVFSKLADLYRFYGLPNEAIKKVLDLCIWSIEHKDDATFISCLRKVVETQPKNLNLRLSFAKLLIAINRAQEAQDELKRLKVWSEESGNDAILSEIKKLLPQHDGGEELDPKSRIELGNLLYEIGSKDEAIVEFNKAASDLVAENRPDEAIAILNRIIEIDPGNAEAIKKIKELRSKEGAHAQPEPATAEAQPVQEDANPIITPVIVPEYIDNLESNKPSVQEPHEAIPIKNDLDILQDLSREVAGFSISGALPTEEPAAPSPEESPITQPSTTEDVPTLEGQIADIEFLLKEAEAPPMPSFELAQQFDEFRNNIIWENEDIRKKTDLAKIAFAADLYEAALGYVKDDKDVKDVWPTSLEIIGSSLVKLGRYSDAIKTIGPMILLEDIPEKQKVELRYILASAYEGLGDFENALREIEHILAINPNYRDVREIYQLLGGRMKFEEPVPVETPPAAALVPKQPAATMEVPAQPFEERPVMPQELPEITVQTAPSAYPLITEDQIPVEHAPAMQIPGAAPTALPTGEIPEKKIPEDISEGLPKGDNITFL
ncbi:MAG TPA: hypothetical protein VF399_09195 [bacterium]